MSDIYDELIKEGTKIKKEYQKTKYIYRLFFRFTVAVICTCVACYLFSKLNEIFYFYSSIVATVLFFICFIRLLNNINIKGKNSKQKRLLINYIIVVSYSLIPYCDFLKLNVIIFKIILMFIIFFSIMMINKYFEKINNIATIFIMICIFFLHKLKFIESISIFWLEFSIYLCSYIFEKINKLISDSDETLESLDKRLYGHLFCLYTLFMCICVLIG